MKLLPFGFLLVASRSLIFCQDIDKVKHLFSRIDALESTVQLLSKHIERQDEYIHIIQKTDQKQQTLIEELEDLVRFQQEYINDAKVFRGEEKSRSDLVNAVNNTASNQKMETQESLAGDHGSNISHISDFNNIREHLYVLRGGKSMKRQTPEAVAFHATIDVQTHVTHLTKGQAIVFDSVHLNIGGGYHSSAGIFIAPTLGIYMFSLSVMLNAPTTWITLGLYKNGAVQAEAYANGYDQGSVSVTTQLKIGDEVIVKVLGSDLGMVYGEKLTSFMGMLIMAY